jgi:hypothetical protein
VGVGPTMTDLQSAQFFQTSLGKPHFAIGPWQELDMTPCQGDPDLALLIQRWPGLSAEAKWLVLKLIE